MSFDLLFCRDDESVPTVGELINYFQDRTGFTINRLGDDNAQFWYNNQPVWVYCHFNYETNVDAEATTAWEKSGLSFNLNYLRPSFFAYETMPLVERFSRFFGLMVYDPQEDSLDEPNAAKLIESWRRHNEKAVRAMAGDADLSLRYLPESVATSWWSYMRQKEKIKLGVGEDIFVPLNILLMTPGNDFFSMILWPDGIPQFFPPCQFVQILRNKAGAEQEAGLVPYDTVISALKDFLTEYSADEESFKFLASENDSAIQTIIKSFELIPFQIEGCTAIGGDDFYDVQL